MDLTALINEGLISLNLDAKTKEETIQKMADKMQQAGSLSDINQYSKAVLERESKGSTGVGFHVAIPHGKSIGVEKPALAFAKLLNPIDWQSLDGEPVTIVFLIAVPEGDTSNEHLKILSTLSRKLIHEELRNELQAAKTEQDVMNILDTIG